MLRWVVRETPRRGRRTRSTKPVSSMMNSRIVDGEMLDDRHHLFDRQSRDGQARPLGRRAITGIGQLLQDSMGYAAECHPGATAIPAPSGRCLAGELRRLVESRLVDRAASCSSWRWVACTSCSRVPRSRDQHEAGHPVSRCPASCFVMTVGSLAGNAWFQDANAVHPTSTEHGYPWDQAASREAGAGALGR